MKCEKCGGEWIPSKDRSVSLMNCPFCGAPVLNTEKAKSYQDMGEFLQYLVSLYGSGLYENQQKLNNLIADLYQGDERMKRVYRRAIFDDSLSKRIYDLSLRPLNEREVYYNQLVNQFVETNFYTVDFGKQVLGSLALGLQLEIIPPIISTIATKEDGEWMDEFGVVYSADRKKLITAKYASTEFYTIREGTVLICDDAFSRCLFLKKLIFSSSLVKVGKNVFPSVRKFILQLGDNSHFKLQDDILYTADGKELVCCFREKRRISIPDSVIMIDDYAFFACRFLRNLILPDSLMSIGNAAFYGCDNLESLTLPDRVDNIGRGVFPFSWNFSLDLGNNIHFKMQEGVLCTIDEKDLIWCPSTKKWDIPIGYENIRSGAFDHRFVPSHLTFPDCLKNIEDGVFCDSSILETVDLSKTLINTIRKRTFSRCYNLKYLSFPKSLIRIEDSAFSDCARLSDLFLPNSLVYIGDYAFSGCKSLENVRISNSLTYIGNNAFWGCESLCRIILPDSITHIGNNAFPKHCTLQLDNNIHFKIFDGVLYTIDGKELIWCGYKWKVAVLDTTISIANQAFYECDDLVDVTFSSSLVNIGNLSFMRCNSLRSLTLPNTVVNIGDSAFSCCQSLREIKLSNALTYIGREAFSGCESLKNLELPNTLASIEYATFYLCTSLKDLKLPDKLENIGYKAFYGCESLENITLPSTLQVIGNSAFEECKSLKSITIPDSVTNIGDRVFDDCESLQNIYIPKGSIDKFKELLSNDLHNKLTEI